MKYWEQECWCNSAVKISQGKLLLYWWSPAKHCWKRHKEVDREGRTVLVLMPYCTIKCHAKNRNFTAELTKRRGPQVKNPWFRYRKPQKSLNDFTSSELGPSRANFSKFIVQKTRAMAMNSSKSPHLFSDAKLVHRTTPLRHKMPLPSAVRARSLARWHCRPMRASPYLPLRSSCCTDWRLPDQLKSWSP